MTATRTSQAAITAPPARAAAAKPAWTAPAVDCRPTGAEVTAYAGKAAQWRSR
jgi:coenzyme PQQ precursor peptide PqqA